MFGKIKAETATNKTFNLEKDGVTLNFTLRVDTKKQLTTFLILLQLAVQKVTQELNKK